MEEDADIEGEEMEEDVEVGVEESLDDQGAETENEATNPRDQDDEADVENEEHENGDTGREALPATDADVNKKENDNQTAEIADQDSSTEEPKEGFEDSRKEYQTVE